MSDEVLRLRSVEVRRDAAVLLRNVDWTAHGDERWILIGPNGAGKTTLLQVAATLMFPTEGTVEVLGERLGEIDIFDLRPRIGLTSAAIAEQVPPGEKVIDLVLTASYAILGRWKEEYDSADVTRAVEMLDALGCAHLIRRKFSTLSEGERKRVQIARALMPDPELLLLDEPAAGLDLGGREDLLRRLAKLARDPKAPMMVLVTHHVEEVPDGFTHAMLLRRGSVLAAGPIEEVFTARNLSRCFGILLVVVISRSVRIVPQARAGIVERFGRYHRTLHAGLNMVTPFVDRLLPLLDLRKQLDEATGKWGIRVGRVELKAIEPPGSIQDSMEKQMRADRDKRAAILSAEGSKQSAILTAEGERQAAVLKARGDSEALVLRAEADAKAQAARARGQAEAISTVFRAIHEGNPDQRLLAYQYMQMLPQIAQGDANKVWIVPSEIGKALEGIGGFFSNAAAARSREDDGPSGSSVSGPGSQLDAPAGRHAGLEGWLAGGSRPVHDGAVADREGGSVPGAGDADGAPLRHDPALMEG